MPAQDEFVIEILRDVGLVTLDQIHQAEQKAEEEKIGQVEALIKLGFITERDVTKALANQFGLEMISLTDYRVPDDVLQCIPRHIAHRYKVLPVYKHDSTLTVAISDPLDVDTVDSLRYILKMNVEAVVATKSEIEVALSRYYGTADETVEKMLHDITEGEVQVNLPTRATETQIEDTTTTEADAPIIKLVGLIIMEAYRNRASDIHIEPLEKRLRVRYRIDGVLHEVDNPPKRLQPAIISRLKIMANMSIAEKRVPQDGRIQIPVMGKTLDLRVSSLPTNHGESIVMRILDKSSLLLGLGDLGFFSDDQEKMERLISLPDGIFLVTGPTGSGKTTTLYACLNAINKPDRKIITVEDPVEYQLSGINQVQVNPEINLTFAAALRSILRQAPNIIMIGEIRDLETANIAIQASLTGHLVFSTLHTNDAPSAVTRLIDMGVKPFLVASSVRAIMAQRLVRRVCKQCREPYTPTEYEMRVLNLKPEELTKTTIYKGRGCPECNRTGYRGRCGIYEIFVLDDDVRQLIYERVPANVLRARARELGMRTLREDGVRKILAGITTPEEVISITVGDEN
ncbi:MAG: type II secretion system ATPase GspE [Verrucomicrobiae bacterium]|nr:type II secretion system ATPase GspE [Verrucomicrobiae bacterium]MDW8344365.1 type II secretion system ATPase GspE [Verrucomicrobiae bacterium]